MAGFLKLETGIMQSSIWGEDWIVKGVWITMLLLKDKRGYVSASVPGLARSAGVTIGECEYALERLSAPDKYSRTKTKNGKRIEETDGGWFVINSDKYRFNKKELANERVKKHRAKKKQDVTQALQSVTERYNVTPCNAVKPPDPDPDPDLDIISSPTDSLLSANADAPPLVQDKLTKRNSISLSSNCTPLLVTDKDKKRKRGKSYTAEFDHFWGRLLDLNRGYNNRLTTGKWESFKAWKEAKEIPDFPGEEGVLAALERQLLSKDWKKNNGDFVPLFSTWLRAGRWTAVLPKTLKQRIQDGEFDD